MNIDQMPQTNDTHAPAANDISALLSHRLQEIGLFVEQLQAHVYLHCRLDKPVASCTFCTQQQAALNGANRP